MRSNTKIAVTAWLHALFLVVIPCHAKAEPVCEVSVAALSISAGSDGILHWRDGKTATMPLQLSTRYFSERLQLKGNAIQFFNQPVPAEPDLESPPEPLLTLKIPAGKKLIYVVLSSNTDKNGEAKWTAYTLAADELGENSLKLFNASSEQVGITAGRKNFKLLPGKALDFDAQEWSSPFPVKIYRLEPEMKKVFSSTWRVSPGRRELCFIGSANGSVTLRSLMELGAPKAPGPR